MQVTVSDDLAAVAHLAELSDGDAQRAWIIGLFAEGRLSLIQAARLAGLDRAGFQRHLTARGIVVAVNKRTSSGENGDPLPPDKPWLALRGSAHFVGDPFAPAVPEDVITALQKASDGAVD